MKQMTYIFPQLSLGLRLPPGRLNKGNTVAAWSTKKASIIKKAKTTGQFLLPWPKL